MAYLLEKRWDGPSFTGLTRAERRPCRYHAYVPDRLTGMNVALPPEVAADVSDTERAIGSLNADGPAPTNLDALSRLLLRAEAVASSRIEGLEISPRRLAKVEAARLSGQQVTDETALAVLGNVEAMIVAVEQVATRPFIGLDDLLLIHAALLRHTSQSNLGGQVRTTQNWIGGSNVNPCGAAFVPPPPEIVPDLLSDLVAFLNDDRYPPLVQAALAHAYFETVHPFADGNGRTGRALLHVVLRRRGLAPHYVPPISLVLATRSQAYVAGLNATRYVGPADGESARAGILAWIDTFTAAANRATADAARFAERVAAIGDEWRERAKPFRANSTVSRILAILPSAPIITATTAGRLVDRSFEATNSAIDHLARAGVLNQTTIGRRNRAYEAVGLLDAFTDFERALASPTGDTRDSPPNRPVPYRPIRS